MHYDPDLGIFLTKDPASYDLSNPVTVNPYQFCGNNPVMNVDPDGRFWNVVIAIIGAALSAGAVSAAVSAVAAALQGKDFTWEDAWSSFKSGAISGGLSYGIGQFVPDDMFMKTLAHGTSGGIQSSVSGGDFWSGFAGGAAGKLSTYGMQEGNYFQNTMMSGMASGATSWATGGDFGTGFQAGAYQYMYNMAGKKTVDTISGMFSAGEDLELMVKQRDKYNRQPLTESEAIRLGYVKQSLGESLLHKLGGPKAWGNVKYVGRLGYDEAVYNNGRLVNRGINRGTYNLVPQRRSAVGHFMWDMAPWFKEQIGFK